jgi:hypothetical protein
MEQRSLAVYVALSHDRTTAKARLSGRSRIFINGPFHFFAPLNGSGPALTATIKGRKSG